MPTLITTRPLRYNSREMVADQEFTASDKDARILVALRRATLKQATPEPPPTPTAPPERVKRQYRRRDLVAEDRAVHATTLSEVPLDVQIEVEPESTEDSIFRGPSASHF